MGRKRVIKTDDILDAAEKVVARDGAANLTIDAVANEAGVSKATVLYDHKSKQGLIRSMVERAVALDNRLNDEAAARFSARDSAVIRGRIAAAAQPIPEQFRPVALNLCAALAQDGDLRSAVQENQRKVIASILSDSQSPRGALIAYLALEGLKLLEALDYHHWDEPERTRILREIAGLVNAGTKDAAIEPELER